MPRLSEHHVYVASSVRHRNEYDDQRGNAVVHDSADVRWNDHDRGPNDNNHDHRSRWRNAGWRNRSHDSGAPNHFPDNDRDDAGRDP